MNTRQGNIVFYFEILTLVSHDSIVGIPNGSGLDGLRIESWGADFLHLYRLALGPTQPLIQWILGLSKRKAARIWH